MASKRRKLLVLGLAGATAGVVMRLVRGRRDDEVQLHTWEPATPVPPEPAS